MKNEKPFGKKNKRVAGLAGGKRKSITSVSKGRGLVSTPRKHAYGERGVSRKVKGKSHNATTGGRSILKRRFLEQRKKEESLWSS